MRYETPADLVAEDEIANAVIAALGLQGAPKLPLCYILDRVALRAEGVTGFFEIKNRKLKFGEGDGLYLSLYKVLKAHTIKEQTGLPCHLFVRFAGGDIYWCLLEEYDRSRGKAGVFWFGRKDRDENEPCVAFLWEVFRKVEKQ